MSNPLVSIIIPCYNVENYIKECLTCCLNQTYKNIEIICVDNNSQDNTIAIIKSFQKEHRNIILLKEIKQKAAAARNAGIKKANGKWIQFLDADDLLLENKIEHQIMLSDDNAAFIAGASTSLKLDGTKVNHPVRTEHLIFSLFFQMLGNTCSNLYNTKFVHQTNLQDEQLTFSEESDFMFSLIRINPMVIADNRSLTIIREREYGSINKTDKENKFHGFIEVRHRFIEHLKNYEPGFYQANKETLDLYIFNYIRALARYNFSLADDYYQKFDIASLKNTSFTGKMKIYSFALNLLGFKTTEKLYSYFRTNTCKKNVKPLITKT